MDERVTRIDERLTSLEERFREHTEYVGGRFQEVKDLVEHVETRLLTEFFKWASPNVRRQRAHAAMLRAHDAETTR